MGVHDIGDIIFLIGVGLIIGGLCLFGYQGILWLQSGYWPQIEFRDLWLWLGFAEPSFTRQWLEKIALEALHVPLSLLMATFGLFVCLVGFWQRRA
jgi:hypothetical protein